MIDANLAFMDFERNTSTDHFFNVKNGNARIAADMIKYAISNDFTIEYTNTTSIALGFFSQDDYIITYPFKEEKISVRANHMKIIDYFFLESDFEYYKDKIKDYNTFFEHWLLDDCFFENFSIPKDKDFYLIWRTEFYFDKQLYNTYDQKIKFVKHNAFCL